MRKEDDGVTVLCPDGVVDALFDALARSSRAEHSGRYYTLAVIDTVYRRRAASKSHQDAYVPIPYQAFHEAIPNRRVRWAKEVVSDGRLVPPIIEWDAGYWFDPTRQRTGECMAYRPAAEFRGVKPARVRVKDHKLGKKLRASAGLAVAEAHERIAADPTAVVPRIERNVLATVLHELPDSLADDPIVDHFTGRRRHWCDECPMGRVHHHVGNSPKPIRPYLRFTGHEGFPLMLLDIANSQPLILGMVVSEISARLFGGRRPPTPTTHPRGGTPPHPTPTPATPPRTAVRFYPEVPLCGKASWYVQSCLDGMIYERVSALSGEPEWKYGRDGAKNDYMVFAYGDAAMTDNRFGRVVREMDPLFYDWLVYAKGTHQDGLLAKLMQREESQVMIGTVCRRLMDDRPDLPIVPIHDAFLCLPADADRVQREIETAWLERFGVSPRVRREDLSRIG